MKALITGALGAAVLLASVGSYAQISAEDQIKYRKAGYNVMSWNMGKIKAQVIDGSVPFNAEQVAAAATAIAAVTNSGMGALYGPDTAKNVGSQTTRLNPEFFNNLEEVGRIGKNFAQAANKLASEAATGDQARIRTAFGEVGQSCKACHDKFRLD